MTFKAIPMAPQDPSERFLRKGGFRASLSGAAAVVTIALIRDVLLAPYVEGRAPFVTFLLATALAAWMGGLLPGLATTVFGMLAGLYLFTHPRHAFRMEVPLDYFLLFFYLIIGGVISIVCELLHRSRWRAEENVRTRSLRDAQIRESERHLREVTDMMPHLVWSTTADGTPEYLNRRWVEAVNVAIEDLRDFGWKKLVHPDDQTRVLDTWESARKAGEVFAAEYRLRMADGSWRWHQCKIVPMRTESGKISKWVGTALDIAESRHAVEVLKASEERFRRLADSAPILIWISDTTKQCVWFNKLWLQFTGRSLDEEIASRWSAGVHPDDRRRCAEMYDRQFDARNPFELEYRLRRHDGEYRWILDRGTPFYESGGIFTGYIGGCIDITERKEAEAQSKKSLKIERAAREETERIGRMKDEFLATLSHEMRTPLNAILGWASLLRRGSVTQQNLAQAIETIERNARTQAQLIEDLLDMSRILSGKLHLEVKQVCALKTVTQVLETLKPAIDARKIQIRTEHSGSTFPILGDPNRLQQIIWNLLSNAIKFTPPGGQVTIRVEKIESSVKIHVQDSGKGIPPDFLPFVFDRFRQLDSSSTRPHSGLGIGLSIVKQLVELHGGTVKASSDGENRGAVFTVHLPVAAVWHAPAQEVAPKPEPEPEKQHANEPDAQLSGIEVLVVDDDPDACDLLREIMGGSGANVKTAMSAADALEVFAKRPPHLLISDIAMPGEDGCSLIERIRGFPPEKGGHIPAIALTAFTRSHDRRRIILAGYQIHLAKPVDPMELLAIAARLMGREAPDASPAPVPEPDWINLN